MSKETLTPKSRIVIEKHRGGELVERREIKNVVRQRLVEHITYYIWHELEPTNQLTVYHPLRLGIADQNKLTIKYIDASGLSRTSNTAAGQHIVRITWTDGSSDEYTVGYLGLFHMRDTLTAGQDNITGDPGAMAAVRVDPPMTKAAEDTMTFIWDIIFPFGEVS